MNSVFYGIVVIAFVFTGYRQLTWNPDSAASVAPMQALATGMIESAKSSVTLAIGLIGVMALFLGLMKIAEAGGLLQIIARLVRPLMVRLFPDVPAEHPAMGAMIMNMSANALGLGNAATPFGIRAMQALDTLNPNKGTATNAMALFLAINTSSVTLLPTGVIALRASVGSIDPAGIVPTTLFATFCSTTVAIIAAKSYQRLSRIVPINDDPVTDTADAIAIDSTTDAQELTPSSEDAYSEWVSYLALFGITALIPLAVIYGAAVGPWIVPGMMLLLLSFGLVRGVSVYESFVEGARDGFQVAVRIIPYLVAILVAVGMLRESGALQVFTGALGALTGAAGLPGEALPMALLRPLSGSGAYGILAATIQDPAIGPDSYVGYLVSTLQGSTETTFYVIAVYFGAVQVRRVRHALAAGLTADLAGIIGAVAACWYLYA
ncbi:MAG: spore maturation protein [Gammaproteobacteria bacterium]|nr:spore maturation protein [Gammaproteobacteria bacterium]MDH3468684.1 spore maturation protein [Gammaproteobacteria bacterium]